MTQDLPSFYRNVGYIGHVMEDAIARRDDIYNVRVDLDTNGCGTSTSFFSRGNFREDAVHEAERLLAKYSAEGAENRLQKNWKRYVLGTRKMTFTFGDGETSLAIGAQDFKRIAEIAKDSYVTNPTLDEDKNQVLTRDEFLREFRGAYADSLINGARFCFGGAAEIPQPPDDANLAKILETAGQLHDKYVALPVGSLLITKDFIFPYVIGRKKHRELRWKSEKYCRYHESYGARMPTADTSVYLTGVETDCAPHMFKNPVFRADFGFSMNVVSTTFVVPKQDEKEYVAKTVDLMSRFNTIWVMNAPPKLPADVTPLAMNGTDWFPTKEEFVRIANDHLEIQ